MPQALSHASILQGLKELKPLRQVHAHIIASGLARNIFLSNRLMNSYASCGLMAESEQIFRQMPQKNVVSWTILVSGYAKNDLFMEAVDVFREVILSGIKPNAVAITSLLPALANLGLARMGKSVHCFWIRCLFGASVFVETSLVGMYSKFGCMDIAQHLFDRMSQRNTVSWNALISGYSHNGFGEEALWHFNLMRRKGFSVDFFTVASVISSSSSMVGSFIGTGLHGFSIKTGLDNDRLVKTTLMDIYVNGNNIDDAYQIFTEMPVKDVVAWTLMLTGFSIGQYWKRAIEHFNEMMAAENIALDSVAFIGILSSCSSSGALQQGLRVHALAMKMGLVNDIFVGSALIDMYANCGNLADARKVFEGIKEKDVVCWNAMIAGNGMVGYGHDAVDLFLQMNASGINPNESTFVSILHACSHAGMVDQGLFIFDRMVKDWHIVPNLRHYACVVDLMGRAGRLDDAKSLISSMPLQPDSGVYGALLGACRVHGNIEMGLDISQKFFELEANDAGYYVLLSNMYASAGNWGGVQMTRALLRSNGLKKDPGFSSIEINREVFTFIAGEKDHPQYAEIDKILWFMISKIKKAGYVPDLNSVFQDVLDNTKMDILYHHSEKMAIAFGLLRTKPGTIIRITKNLRTCNDCHSASKFISTAFGRELLIKDANRFHVFQDGICSCGDYW
ncbi:pentatricopeptide repeat-containing protein At3g57430, chloroplastic-like [Malania oleifera]|uniref:pentatricopeptide repeat-containing protein At3g57430, chloroplastic-like n=1 Tax=Malania oleifera TaxID=397392 RepID=UPI0025AE7A98|nr:pentatricopeptide repeat-containing protein At3g57430, chloroplastic-like [Malania oleifera]XP_057965086.1 pentatricopeptide repeat-containing protein At3g57430, chloroplastic-like [Malania oleifera]XP_057965087.1 pentatricopeptide repeat-containing protein At3g57430, chloroplastic-like [Malania oleifera]